MNNTNELEDKFVKEFLSWWHKEGFGCAACDYSVCENRYAKSMARQLRKQLKQLNLTSSKGSGR